MSNGKGITEADMNRPSEFGGEPKGPHPKRPHEVLRDIYRSDPTDPGSGPTTT